MQAKILVVDDSVTVRRVVDASLSEEGFEVISFSNGQDALAAFATQSPDAVIADVHLPGTTGYAVAAEMKAQKPEIPVLLLVGTFEPLDQGEVERSGALGYLMKPFDARELVARVSEILPGDPVADAKQDDLRESDVQEADAEAQRPPMEIDKQVAPQETELAATVEKAGAPESPDDTARSTEGRDDVSGERVEGLTEEDVDRIARRVVELMSGDVVERIASEVVPRVAQAAVEDRIAELEQEAE